MPTINRSAWMSAVVALLVAGGAVAADAPGKAKAGKYPDLSGYWNLSSKIAEDKKLMQRLPPNTAVLADTGAAEFPRDEYGGLKVKPAALAAAAKWNPADDMALSNACKPPSIVYAMQGPFPMEIFQGTELIVIKLEYFDMMRVVFMDGRHADEQTPDSKTGFSVGHWDADTLVVDTTHIEPATITNNGLFHSNKVHVIERFRVSDDGKELHSTQEFEDPEVLGNRGARFIAWKKKPGEHVYPYECDPTFALEYQNQAKGTASPSR